MTDPAETTENTTDTTHIGHNGGVDYNKYGDHIDRIMSIYDDVDVIMQKAKEECQPLYDDIKVVKEEALDAGAKKKPLNAYISRRRKLRAIEKARANLDEEHQTEYDQLQLALEGEAD